MPDTLNKLLSSTTYTIPVCFQEGAAIVMNHIEAAFDGDDRNEIVTLGGLYECIVSSKEGSVHILVNKIGAKKYVFDKVYTNRTWATKRFLNFVASIDPPERDVIDATPALDLEEQHAHGPVARWIQDDVVTAMVGHDRPARRELPFGAVVETKFVSPSEIGPLWKPVTKTVGWEAPLAKGVCGWVEGEDDAWVAKLKFGGMVMEREADTELEAKHLAYTMANLLSAWKF